MKTKFLRFFIIIFSILIFIISASSNVIAKIAQTSKNATANFGITLLHTSPKLDESGTETYGYRVGVRNTYRIYYGNNDFENSTVCLDMNGNFPGEDVGAENYVSLGSATKDTLKEAYSSLDDEKANAILWIMRNAVLPNDSKDVRDVKLQKIFKNFLDQYASSMPPLTIDNIKETLTEDDLVFAYQCAIWEYTNGNILDSIFQGCMTENNWNALSQNKNDYIREIIRYYKNNVTNADIIPNSSNTQGNAKITKTSNTTYQTSGNKIFAGPFKIENAQDGNYSVKFTFKNEGGTQVPLTMGNTGYYLTSSASIQTTLLSETDILSGQDFYFAFPESTSVRTIDIELEGDKKSDTVGTVWKAVEGNNNQPLLSIERTETPNKVNSSYTFGEPQYDVALRKFIVSVYRKEGNNWNKVYNGEEEGRTPNEGEGDSFNQVSYKHQKEPVDVRVGDRVVYGINLYNEMDTTVRITKIIDHLPPSGLKYIDTRTDLADENAVNANGRCMSAGRNITYGDYTNDGYICELGPNGSLKNSIKIEFEVTADAAGKIVTNIAEITEMADTSGTRFTTGKDIDSDGGNATLPTTEEGWQNYTGNNNKSELNDSTYYYKGQEDDDDFEKIRVPGNIDLALRKSIITVNGEQKNRAKEPDTAPLKDGDINTTTSRFTDIKTPVQVKTGDIVIYTVRVFNEGDTDAYASEITDYIPEGLGFIVNHDINYSNGWTFPNSTNMMKISAIDNATSNLSASDFSKCGQVASQDDVKNIDVIPGNIAISTKKLDTDSEKLLAFNQTTNKLDIHELQVACVVLEGADESTLRNIAAITEYKDENKETKNEDIDSQSNNDLSNFNESNHQDDEDYEKLVLKETVYDLALKKYVSEVKDATGSSKTIIDGQKRNLQITSVDALEHRTSIADKADATYSFGLDKATNPVQVEQGDSVIYTIRIYNEGLTDAVVENLVDGADGQLSFVPAENSSINNKYGWTKFTNTGDGTGAWDSGVKSTYLENKVIPAFDSTKKDEPSTFDEEAGIGIDHGVYYAEVKIEFKVTSNKSRVLRNISEIHTDDGDDNDSIPNNKNGTDDDEDFDVIVPLPYDLALKKYVSSVLDATNQSKRIPDNQKRTLRITDVTALENRSTNSNGADATYSFGLDKENAPVVVERNDSVIYTIRIYNEGLTDAKVQEIVDSLPNELTFLNNSTINQKYGWDLLTTTPESTGWKSGLITSYYKDTIIPAFDSSKKDGPSTFDEETGIGIDHGVSYVELKLECRVNTLKSQKIRNIAEIMKDDGDDDDSIPNNMVPTEDDEDFDVILIQQVYDLALKKYVSSVSDATNQAKVIPTGTKRNLKITSVTDLENRGTSSEHADAKYSFEIDKEDKPVRVQKDDNVIYTIRVYNEGSIDAKVQEIKDLFPEKLTFLPNSTINKKYGWKLTHGSDDLTEENYYVSEYYKDTVIPAFDSSKKNQSNFNEETGLGIDMGVSYVEFKIELKVETSEGKVIENIAEITEDDGDDDDSDPNNDDPEEDDEDFDVIIPTKFDLALRKFITQIDDKEVDDRIPDVDTAKLEDEESTTADYEHTKEPKIVVKGQTVIYTIRVYNEGTIDGYAAEIKDDMPEGLKFLPNHKINKQYMWKMYDSDGNETENIYKATTIKSDYGSQENGTRRNIVGQVYPESKRINSNLLLAFEPEYMDVPDFIDIKVAFEVNQESVTDGNTIIINTAEVTKNTDKDGNDIEDIDSIPDNNDEEKDDDLDKEYLELKYFDLSLLKYISKVIVTENGVTKETNTGYNGKENPEPVVKVEISKKNLSNTQVKYVYSIKVTNEGQIEGYAKEVKDRIPAGLAFYEEDNKDCNWKIGESGVVTTDYLANKLLQPGDSEIITLVLRWENSESNLGQKINTAEISKDENPYGVPDLDSTPDNNKDGEDDQDEAIAVISLTTGSAPIYIALITMIIAILGTGFYLIYKYVVKK